MASKFKSALKDNAPLILAELRRLLHGMEVLPSLPPAGEEGRMVFVASSENADTRNAYLDMGNEWRIMA